VKKAYRFLLSLLTVVLMLTFFGGCNYEEIFTDLNTYPDIFQLAGRAVASEMYRQMDDGTRYNDFASLLFPDTITGLNVVDYYCIYDYSERFEIFLSVQYTPKDYADETDRLSAVKHNGEILYTTEHFSYPAYATALGYNNDCSEYALLDEEQCCIYYVYLQGLRLRDVRMPAEYLPYGYSGYGRVEGINFTIYNTPETYIPIPSSY